MLVGLGGARSMSSILDVMVVARIEGAQGDRPKALPMGEQEE